MSQPAMVKLKQRIDQVNSLVCVGLDSDITHLPSKFLDLEQPQFEFNKWIIDQTHEHVCAYKPNLAFYEARGEKGWRDLRLTMEYLHSNFPDIFTIADAKRADIGNTNLGYVEAIYDQLGFDAITLHPYLGREALAPFLDRADKVSIILCRTSNPGAGELQDLMLETSDKKQVTSYKGQETRNKLQVTRDKMHETRGKMLWQVVAEKVANEWNKHNNCMLVVGATYPKELGQVRQIVGDMPILVPGIGAQGGDLQAILESGLDSRSGGLIISSSRNIIFAEDPGLVVRGLKEEIVEVINVENNRKNCKAI